MKQVKHSLLFVGLFWLSVCRPLLAEEGKHRQVVVICVDGLPAYLLNDPNAPLPTIRKLAQAGVVAEAMIPANPSVTWPNHSSLTTGVWPEKHGVLFNGVLERNAPGLPAKVNPNKDQADLIHVQTIYDILHDAQLTTAAINWPCTRNSPSLDDNFPDVPDAIKYTTPRLISELKETGIATAAELDGFAKLSTPVRDRIWTQAACHILRERKPNLLLLHILNVDGIHHRYGPQTPAGYSAVAYADTCVRDVVETIEAAGLRDSTAIFVVSDHGFMAIPQTLQPNVLLRQAGLLTVENNQLTAARAHAISEGGIAMVYLTVREKAADDRKTVMELFQQRPEIAEILTPADYEKHGLPQPQDHPQMADLVLVAKEGYGFSATATGDEFVVKSNNTVGAHGFLSSFAKMNATFVACGAGIRRGEKIGVINNIDVTPTIAKLLGVSWKAADGKVLSKILQDQPDQ